jgi:diguanylate cyclase (GGDEF)-like protein
VTQVRGEGLCLRSALIVERDIGLSLKAMLCVPCRLPVAYANQFDRLGASFVPIRGGPGRVCLIPLAMQPERAVGTALQLPTDALRLRALYDIQDAVHSSDDEASILTNVCAILARDRPFHGIWMGAAQTDGSVTVLAYAGADEAIFNPRFAARWDASTLGNGAIGQAIRSGHPIVVAGNDPVRAPWIDFPGNRFIKAVAAFPFHLDDTMGAVGIAASDEETFSADEIAFLASAVDFVFATLESARLRRMIFAERDRARRSEGRIGTLWSLAVARGFDLDAQAEAIISEGARALGFEWGAIGHVESEILIVDFVASLEGRRRFYPLDVSLSREAIARGRTFASADLKSDPRHALSAPVLESGLRAFIATPFEVGGRHYVLAFGSSRPLEDDIDRDDLSYVDLLASFFSAALRQRDDAVKIRHLQNHDMLTGLPNRERFHERLDEVVARASRSDERFAVVSVDLDHFHQTIDEVRVVTADEVIAELGRRLNKVMHSGQEIFRGAGDSFTVIIPNLESPEQADRVARAVLAAIELPFHTEYSSFMVSASLGMAIFPDDGLSTQSLVSAVTAALQRAKVGGTSELRFFASDLDERLSRRRTFMRELEGAVERDELVLHYQPWIDLHSGAVTGAEALVRWRHPVRGLIMPDDFIGLAEEGDAIFAIGNWVFRQAAHFSALCVERGLPLVTSINLSARQLGDTHLLETIGDAIARARIDPRSLELEITETFAVRDPSAAHALLEELRRLGLRVALDDFGIGHSSLSMLKHLPVDIIKIDKAFVRGLPESPSDAAIATAILSLARSISTEVRAEGIEKPAQAEWLTAGGCHSAQGFWLARPLAQKTFLDWMEERTHR